MSRSFEAEGRCCIVVDLAALASSKRGVHTLARLLIRLRATVFSFPASLESRQRGAGGLRPGGFPLFVLILKEINNKNQRALFNALIKVFTSLEPTGQRGVRAGESVVR